MLLAELVGMAIVESTGIIVGNAGDEDVARIIATLNSFFITASK